MGIYRRFVKGYGVISKPLTKLLRKNAFGWNEHAQAAFEKLKEAMTTAPVLALPDFSKPFIIETDAADGGIGAVLMQGGHLLAYISKALSLKHQAMSVYEKGLLAIIFAVSKWSQYLVEGRFTIRTDHQSLKYLLEQRFSNSLQQKWLSKLMGYDFDIVYKRGKEKVCVGGFSRVPSAEINVLV